MTKFTSMAGFFSKKQYAAIADKELAIKLLNERCLECSICAMFFSSSLTVSIKALFLSIIHTVRLVMMPGFLILNHIFFLLQCKFLAKIIGHTINLCNFRLWKHSGNRLNLIIQHYKFNTFIAMFLIITEIYLLLFRTHVIYYYFELTLK